MAPGGRTAPVPARCGLVYARLGVQTCLGRAAHSLDTQTRTLTLDDGARLEYDRLLIATSASPRKWNFPGAGAPGVFKLNWLDDARRLMAHPVESVHQRQRLDRL